jgi:hypothetical protein
LSNVAKLQKIQRIKIKKMTAKLIICNDAGEETIIEQDLGVEPSLNNMNSIENFVLSLKTAMMPKLEQKLLEKTQLRDTQLALIKKKRF